MNTAIAWQAHTQPSWESNNRQVNESAVGMIPKDTNVAAGRAGIGIGGGVCFDQGVVTGITGPGKAVSSSVVYL